MSQKIKEMEHFIAWVEIPSYDFERAVDFYNHVFNVNMQGIDCGTEKMACFPNGEGAIIFAKNYTPSKEGVIVSLLVPDSIESAIRRIEEKGGKILIPKTKIEAEGRGSFALILDSEGNRIGLYEKR